VNDDRSSEAVDAPATGDAHTDDAPAAPTPMFGTNQDARSLAAAADALRADRESDRTISALRAATTAAGTQPTLAQITEVRRLHEATIEAARHPRRFGSKASARRRLENAIARRTAALHEIGFSSFESFSDVYGPTLTLDRTEPEADETIARICELLIELGVNPTADPLRAASEFLTTHESELVQPEMTQRVTEAQPDTPSIETRDDRVATPGAPETAAPAATDAPWVPAAQFPKPSFEAPPAEPAVEPSVETPVETPTAPVASDEPATTEVNEPARPEGDVVDRWISAEARAERMHAEVERAQAELAAMLARSADLEQTADARVDQLDAANAQLHISRARVDELERAVARLEHHNAELLESNTALHGSNADHAQNAAELEQARSELERAREETEQVKQRADSERDDLERALATSRDRVTELETSVANRERALAEAERSSANAREALNARDDELANDHAELDQARVRAAELEAELAGVVAAHAAELAQSRARVTQLEAELTGRTEQLESELAAATAALESERAAHAEQLGAARAEQQAATARAEELGTELETTRRSLEALDAHAEQVEAQLANARRAVDSLDVRRELDTLRKELAEARHELGHLELQRAETARALAQDRLELQQLQRTLLTMREQAVTADTELVQAQNAIHDAQVRAEAAERARDAITIDAADLLARAEAEASGLLERANRDAEAIRQEAMRAAESMAPNGARPATNGHGTLADGAIHDLADRVSRLERKIAKQRRRLDRLTGKRGTPAGLPRSGDARRTPSYDAASHDLLASAERDAAEIRRAARRDREQFRAELVGLLSRFAPVDDEYDEFED
jgi:chromosome segregation ATPase